MTLKQRIVAIFTAAAAIIVGTTLSLQQSVQQAMTETGQSMTCAEFGKLADAIDSPEFSAVAYVDLLPAACKAAALSRVKCWKMASGNYCRNGREYGPGLGGTKVCAADTQTDIPIPCGTELGNAFMGVIENWDTADDGIKRMYRKKFLQMIRDKAQESNVQ